MKRRRLWAWSFVVLSLALGLPGCKRESPPTGGGATNGEPGALIIEYETFPSILFEAESGLVVAPVALYDDAEASGGRYALAPEGPNHEQISEGGEVEYAIQVAEAGEYVLWLRAKWSGQCGDSLGILLDGQDLGNVGDAVYEERWHWVRLLRKKLSLAAGPHFLAIVNREDGSAWDQVLLTQDEDCRPTGVETADAPERVVLTDTVSGKPEPAEEIRPPLEAPVEAQVIEAPPRVPAADRDGPVTEEKNPAPAM